MSHTLHYTTLAMKEKRNEFLACFDRKLQVKMKPVAEDMKEDIRATITQHHFLFLVGSFYPLCSEHIQKQYNTP